MIMHVLADSGWPSAISAISVGGLAFVAAGVGVGQKWRNDARERWWDRTQWALGELSEPDEQRRTIGLLVLGTQLTSRLASGDDAEMCAAISMLATQEQDPDHG